jgi:hypothetical protein
MSCYIYSSVTTRSAREPGHTDWLGFLRVFRTLIEAFDEALDMRRVAYRRHCLSDE